MGELAHTVNHQLVLVPVKSGADTHSPPVKTKKCLFLAPPGALGIVAV